MKEIMNTELSFSLTLPGQVYCGTKAGTPPEEAADDVGKCL